MVSKPSNLPNLVGKLLEQYVASKSEIEEHLQNGKDQLADASLSGISKIGAFLAAYFVGNSKTGCLLQIMIRA